MIATKDGLSSLLLVKDGKEPFHYVSFESQGIYSLLGAGGLIQEENKNNRK